MEIVNYLRLCEHEVRGHFEPLGPGEVLVHPELVFELQELLAREGGAGTPRLAQHLARAWKTQ